MRKKAIFLGVLVICLQFFCAFMPNNSFVVGNARISCWQENTLVTDVDINFNNIDAKDINCIKFEIFDKGEFVTSAVSQGENLQNLLKYCSSFWDTNRNDYLSVQGVRTLTCKFSLREKSQDNGYWERESFNFDTNSCPQTLVVTICTNSRDYTTSN